MLRIRARACISCQEYIIISPDDPKNQELIKIFDQNHRGHPLVILDLNEVKDRYKIFKSPRAQDSTETTE